MKNSLRAHNTLRLQSSCESLDSFDSVERLQQCLQWSQRFSAEALVLGYGSNVVLPAFYPGMVLFNRIMGTEVISETDDHVHVVVGAGENWHAFVEQCMHQQWYGLENLASIPGSVGAAPVQNIGAYGVDVSQWLIQCEVFCRETRQCYQLSAVECGFGYRSSIFKQAKKGKLVILRVHFLLNKRPQLQLTYPSLIRYVAENRLPQTPLSIFNAVVAIRGMRLPRVEQIGNAGSFFVNPIISQVQFDELIARFSCAFDHYVLPDKRVKLFAGQLLKLLGWQTVRRNGFSLYSKNALILTHDGEGSQSECLQFAKNLQDSVRGVFGVSLTIEPEVITGITEPVSC
jgi:UDP-N-acetylmuramate dehydrogenase